MPRHSPFSTAYVFQTSIQYKYKTNSLGVQDNVLLASGTVQGGVRLILDRKIQMRRRVPCDLVTSAVFNCTYISRRTVHE